MGIYSELADKLVILGYEKYRKNLEFEYNQIKDKNKIKIYYAPTLMKYPKITSKIKKEENIDIIISHCPISGMSAVLGNMFKKKRHVLVLCMDYVKCYTEGTDENIIERMLKVSMLTIMLNIVMRNAEISALSTYLEKLAKRYGAKKTTRIPVYGVDMGIVKPGKKDNKLEKKYNIKGNKVILTVTRLTPEKGTMYAILALKEIKKEIENVKLIIVGKGVEEEKLKGLAKKLGIEDDVIFLGHLPFAEMPKHYNLADAYLQPSLSEGLGFAPAEAMASKKPVVASNIGGIPDIVIHDKTGLLVKARDHMGIAEAIKKILKDKELANRLSENGYKHVKENFEESRVKKRFVDFIKHGN